MENKKKQLSAEKEKRMNRVALGALLIFVVAAIWFVSTFSIKPGIQQTQAINQLMAGPVEAPQVCMVGNRIENDPTLEVVINDKSYFVCCPKCENELKYNRNNEQIARDFNTGEPVDKASAFIAMDKHRNGKVVYFKTRESLNSYLGVKGDNNQ